MQGIAGRIDKAEEELFHLTIQVQFYSISHKYILDL
jgi:hypothetical protein